MSVAWDVGSRSHALESSLCTFIGAGALVVSAVQPFALLESRAGTPAVAQRPSGVRSQRVPHAPANVRPALLVRRYADA